MRMLASTVFVLAVALTPVAAGADAPSREQALAALQHPDAAQRLEGIDRLAEAGEMADAHLLLAWLADPEPRVRAAANAAIWQIWGRSGDPSIDRLYDRGLEQMRAGAFHEALATFDAIVKRRPEFAEGWNKRATLYFLLGENEKSLADCDEVLRLNPDHFGALSGAGQIHLRLDHPRQALESFRRALDLNPNLDGLPEIIRVLEDVVRRKAGQTA